MQLHSCNAIATGQNIATSHSPDLRAIYRSNATRHDVITTRKNNEAGLTLRLAEVSGVAITSLQSDKEHFLAITYRGSKVFWAYQQRSRL